MYSYRWTVIVLKRCRQSVFSEQTIDFHMEINEDHLYKAPFYCMEACFKPISDIFFTTLFLVIVTLCLLIVT